jgi:ribosomal protein S6
MDKKNFTRVADKKHNAGFYVNVIFESQPAALPQLQSRFALSEDVFRVLFTEAPAPKLEKK